MYRLTVKSMAYGRYDKETGTINKLEAEQHFNCESLQQLTGLLEFMIATSENELDLRIARREDDD